MRLHIGQIGDPPPIRGLGVELAIHQIGRAHAGLTADGGTHRRLAPHRAADLERVHQPLHRAPRHAGPFAPQLRPDLVGAVHPKVLREDARDLGLQRLVAHAACRRRPGDRGVVRGGGERQHAADRLDAPAVPMGVDEGHGLGRRGSSAHAKKADAVLRISFARRSSRFSRSSWRMRSFSSLVTPGRCPPSTSARRTQMRRVSAVIPNLLAIEPIAAHSEGCSPRCSITIRTARSRSSCGYLFGLVIAPSSQGMEPPGNPGRFSRSAGHCPPSRRQAEFQAVDQ